MWTLENRSRYNRDKLRHSSDLTDKEWEQIEPLIPLAKRGGRSVPSIYAKSSTASCTF